MTMSLSYMKTPYSKSIERLAASCEESASDEGLLQRRARAARDGLDSHGHDRPQCARQHQEVGVCGGIIEDNMDDRLRDRVVVVR